MSASRSWGSPVLREMRELIVGILLVFVSAVSPCMAGWTSPTATVEKIQFQQGLWWVQLDTTVTITNPHTCSNWDGAHWAVINAISTDASKAMLSGALLAHANQLQVRLTSSSCTAGNNPIIDYFEIRTE